MKKLLLILVMLFSIAAAGNTEPPDQDAGEDEDTASVVETSWGEIKAMGW